MPTALPQGAMRQPLAEGLLNDVASGKLSSDAFANRKLITIAVSSRMTQSPNRIRYFGAARSAVENLPRAQHFPDRGYRKFRSAGVDSLQSVANAAPDGGATAPVWCVPIGARVSSRRSARRRDRERRPDRVWLRRW